MERDALRELTMLCQQLRNAERELAVLDEQWKAKKEQLRQLSEEDIPALMTELGVKKITLETGELVEVRGGVEASIPKEDLVKRAEAFAWLEDNGHGGLIKTVVVTQFGRDELEQAKALLDQIVETTGKVAIMDRSVHPNTLQAFIKERLASGEAVPLELFNARPISKAKVK